MILEVLEDKYTENIPRLVLNNSDSLMLNFIAAIPAAQNRQREASIHNFAIFSLVISSTVADKSI